MPETLEKVNTENKILEYLLKGNTLTTLDCLRLFHSTELRVYISHLIKRGYNITGERVIVDCVDGHKANIKRFRIEA
jgi:hypothetical protein